MTIVCDNGPELTCKATFFWVRQSGVEPHFGEVDEAFLWLERAYKEGDPGLSQILGDQFL
jgi:hypothetical protein